MRPRAGLSWRACPELGTAEDQPCWMKMEERILSESIPSVMATLVPRNLSTARLRGSPEFRRGGNGYYRPLQLMVHPRRGVVRLRNSTQLGACRKLPQVISPTHSLAHTMPTTGPRLQCFIKRGLCQSNLRPPDRKS